MNRGLLREVARMALEALHANRLRSALALLGIIIGVTTVIAMVALVNGFQRSVEESIRSTGSNTIYIHRIRPGVNVGGHDIPDSLKQRKAFTVADGEAILAGAPAVRAVTAIKYYFSDAGLPLRYSPPGIGTIA